MKKLVVYILVLILVIWFGIAIGLNVKDDNKTIPTANKQEETEQNKENNKEEVNEEEKKPEQNTNEEDKEEIGEGIPDKSGEPKTDLEKAIEIVEEDWGENRNVYFAGDGKTDSGEYIICVRDASTTNALAWYKVNIENGTCEDW